MKSKTIHSPFASSSPYLLIFFGWIVFGITINSCTNSKNPDETKIAIQDTTPIGKRIADISIKISKDPKNAQLFNDRAALHLQRNDVANALMDMEKVMLLDTTNASYFLTLADVHLASGKPGKSKAALEKCMSLDPNNKLAYEKLAELFFIAQQYKDAIKNLDEVLKLEITNPKAYFMKGMCYRDMGDTTKAVSSFQTAIEQRTDYDDAYLQLAMIFHNRNSKTALQYYDGAIRANPKNTDALYGRGLFYQENERNYDQAVQDYTNAILINPKAANAHYALGYIHYQYLKVYSQAIIHFNDAINVSPEWPEAYFNRGLTYETQGNVAAAQADYEKALKLNPNYKTAEIALARVKTGGKL
ncbi:MAG: tetratricopeptide repeat protein [Bacteroidetes bacterium]|nr:tetratricopeptide repeat protein [Bacteroidota bacterium]